MNHLQHIIDGMNKEAEVKRAASQMTLGALIAKLESLPPDTMVSALKEPHSYRGYYSDLAFESTSRADRMPASELLDMCRRCMGRTFEGYKGGDFQMHERTPVWIGTYGHSDGLKILSVREDGTFETAEDTYE